MAGSGGGGADNVPPGPEGQAGQHGAQWKGWASIASMNVAQRKKKNTLEIRLESDRGVSCTTLKKSKGS